ncbi:MAG: hypothetical protein WAN50_00265 [Minisyncoccia bacterium]
MIEVVPQPSPVLSHELLWGEVPRNIEVDTWLDRVYTRDYKCFDFVREVWQASFGEDVGDKLVSMIAAVGGRRLKLEEVKRFTVLEKPVSPCFVLYQRKGVKTPPHIGIWIDGSVLHLAITGAQFLPFAIVARQWQKVTFFQ